MLTLSKHDNSDGMNKNNNSNNSIKVNHLTWRKFPCWSAKAMYLVLSVHPTIHGLEPHESRNSRPSSSSALVSSMATGPNGTEEKPSCWECTEEAAGKKG